MTRRVGLWTLAVSAAVAISSDAGFADSLQYTASTKIGSTTVYYSYTVYDDYAKLGSFGSTKAVGTFDIAPSYSSRTTREIGLSAFNGCTGITAITIPESVEDIGNYAFASCYSLTEMTLPLKLKHLGAYSFAWCKGLKRINVPSGIGTIWNDTFSGTALTDVTIPAKITNICDEVFYGCSALTNIVFEGAMPTFGTDVFGEINPDCVITVKDATGWDYYAKNGITPPWEGLTVVGLETDGNEEETEGGEETDARRIYLTVTNVVVHYVVTVPISGMVAPVSEDVGIVNVITEIKGGNVAVPESWTNNYPNFAEKFGTDFSAAIVKPSGKKRADGSARMVWEDFVAGTDPTDESDVFTATITMVDGKPEVAYKPQLTEAEKAKRVYTTWGKAKLTDEWAVVGEGEEELFNFFKVTVEMR